MKGRIRSEERNANAGNNRHLGVSYHKHKAPQPSTQGVRCKGYFYT